MHPIAFSIGSIDIYWYGLDGLAFASGYYRAHYFAKITTFRRRLWTRFSSSS